MRARLVGAALVTVVIGAVIRYGWGSPGSGTVYWTVGMAVMLVGTAGLTAVLLRTMAKLRRIKEPRRPDEVETSSASPAMSSMSSPTALRDSAAVGR